MAQNLAGGLPAAARPAGLAGRNKEIQAVVGALSVAAAWFVLPSPSPGPGETDPDSVIYFVASLLAFTLGLLLMYVCIASIQLPPVLVNRLMLATIAAAVAAVLFSPPLYGRQSMGSLEAEQQAECVIPVLGSLLPPSANNLACPLLCEVGRTGKEVVCF